ncbi:MAG: peptidase M23, partial [Acetomicrobium sp.]|nr:peptidase M23 [Acetomicrobium sp.]
GIGILDGGLPHYGFGGVLAGKKIEIGDPVYIEGVRIGHVTKIYSDGFARFEVEPFSVKLDNFNMKGISCYMGLSGDFMWKLIPQDGKKMSLKDKASVIIGP